MSAYNGHRVAIVVSNGDSGDVVDQVRIVARLVPENQP
jgi:hypothetical protein